MVAKILEAAVLQGVWLACVLGAANGRPWAGVAAAGAAVAAFLYRSENRIPALRLAAVAGLTGAVADAALVAAGAFSFPAHAQWGWPVPFWMIALWLNFATALAGPLRFLAGRPALAALAGAVGGPASYYAGARLSAVDLNAEQAYALGLIAAEWALAMPWLGWWARRGEA